MTPATLFGTGIVLLLIGALLNGVGWSMHKKHQNLVKAEAPDGLWTWIIDQVKHWYPLLTGEDSTSGQRVAAVGALLAAMGLVAMVVGLVMSAV